MSGYGQWHLTSRQKPLTVRETVAMLAPLMYSACVMFAGCALLRGLTGYPRGRLDGRATLRGLGTAAMAPNSRAGRRRDICSVASWLRQQAEYMGIARRWHWNRPMPRTSCSVPPRFKRSRNMVALMEVCLGRKTHRSLTTPKCYQAKSGSVDGEIGSKRVGSARTERGCEDATRIGT